MSFRSHRPFVACACAAFVLFLSAGAGAQLGVQWLEFEENPAFLDLDPMALSDNDTDVDFAWGDLDKDGWTDLVVVRKEHTSGTGKRANFLLMNEGGVLRDRTAQYATASDIPGDQGFLTLIADKDVELHDINGDTWLDVITSVTLSDGDPKEISHPRIYINLQNDGGGNWLGLKHEEARIPQMLTSEGLAVAPRFCDVTIGDFTGDGSPDLYFVDYDRTLGPLIEEPLGWDLDDRLLVNDGNGFFTDQSFTRLTDAQRSSAFGHTVKSADLNLDGVLDLAKVSSLDQPYEVRAIYNDRTDEGNFQAMGVQIIENFFQPYGMELGDLNNDGRTDVVVADDFDDYYKLNTGTTEQGEVIWGPFTPVTWAGAQDDGFGHIVRIVDLDLDGWNDVAITDVDVDIPGCARRMHIYHNLGGTPGGPITLREEAETTIAQGWKGAVGLDQSELRGTYDVGPIDLDNDGDLDLVISRCAGTFVFENLTIDNELCQTDLGFGGPGNMVLSLCGDDLTQGASEATLKLVGGAPNEVVFIPVGLLNAPTPFKGGTLVPVPWLIIVDLFSTDSLGEFETSVFGGATGPFTMYMQAVILNGSTYEMSNALEVSLGI